MNVHHETIRRYLLWNDHIITEDISKANYLVINTCGAAGPGEKIACQHYRKIYLEKNRKSKIIVIGCLVKINPAALQMDLAQTIIIKKNEELDSLFKNNVCFCDVPKYSEPSRPSSKTDSFGIPDILKNKYLVILLRKLVLFKNIQTLLDSAMIVNRTLLEISSGCTENCTYCAIKLAKGEVKSVPPLEIIETAQQSKHPEKKWISLVAQDCGSYGLDINTNIYELLKDLNKQFPNVGIEISSLHPRWLVDSSISWETISKEFNIKEISIPVQSGSQNTLKRMGRNYELSVIKKKLFSIKGINPKTHYRSHIIVGFPGESFWDYLQNFKVVLWFDICQVFPYQDRPNTASSRMQNKLSPLDIWLRWKVLFVFASVVGAYKILFSAT